MAEPMSIIAPKAPRDPESQKARKRAWDRAAQRASRQKTKARIEHLQHTIQALQRQTSENTVLQLLRKNDELRAENMRLNRMIHNASSILTGGGRASRFLPATVNHRAMSEPGTLPPGTGNSSIVPYSGPLAEDCPGLHHVCSAPDVMDGRDRPIDCTSRGFPGRVFLRSPLYISSGLATPYRKAHGEEVDGIDEVLDHNPQSYRCSCSAWCQVNEFLSQAYPAISLSDPQRDSSRLLLQAIAQGWDCLGREGLIDPALNILRQMDQYMWSPMPKIFRLAIAYKSYRLMDYIFNPGPDTRSKVPEWELPTVRQMTVQHPCAIDFFPWPCVRDRLIVDYASYLTSCGFFYCIHRYFHFHWPYTFEESYLLDDTGFTPSPLFLEQVENLSSWRMSSHFFLHFPEFFGLIPEAKVAEQCIVPPTIDNIGQASAATGHWMPLAD
ncbi:hypothetical protein BDV26DRAFT_271956 [Aspergillus bertholletiae]|uniref:BZIP domain-containing protein n=1 Tax=Aspergillus bertholletiae TaxID=1226010 RepID=A0A5N7AUH5_9EURO|nr:hypothetical protein BDV26DRAFT_271956 [Aspergillus bertholletiae]